MRSDLGDGYAETVRATYPEVPESANFVLYWWHKAADLVRKKKALRFGLITTNALRQTFGRRIIEYHQKASPPLSLVYVVPDHPWVDTVEGAAVRISMTVGTMGDEMGELNEIIDEVYDENGAARVNFNSRSGRIASNLTLGAEVSDAAPLKANDSLGSPGVKLHGSGFILTPDEAKQLGLGKISTLDKHIRPYRNGKDLTDQPRGVFVIDLFGLSEEQARTVYPLVFQHVLMRVKPERDQNNRESYRKLWWIFGEPRRDLRPALIGLTRYIATVETAKHRFFQFLDANVIPDNMLIAIALDDAFFLGVLRACHELFAEKVCTL